MFGSIVDAGGEQWERLQDYYSISFDVMFGGISTKNKLSSPISVYILKVKKA